MPQSYEEAFEAKWGELSAYNGSRVGSNASIEHPPAKVARMLRLQAKYQRLTALGLDLVTEEPKPTKTVIGNRDALLESCEQMLRKADDIDRAREPDHELKTWPGAFQALLDGIKTHEIRKKDRHFAVDQVLQLREWDEERTYSGREVRVLVTYLSQAGTWGLPDDLVVMSIRVLSTKIGLESLT